MQNNTTIEVLNDLISVSEDGQKGFAEAAEIATDANLKLIFQTQAQECATGTSELQSLVVKLGGKPEDSGSVAGAAHRGWVKVKSLVEDKNIAVLEEVERGQDHAKAAYAKALKADIEPTVRGVIERQSYGATKNHDQVRNLRNTYKATT